MKNTKSCLFWATALLHVRTDIVYVLIDPKNKITNDFTRKLLKITKSFLLWANVPFPEKMDIIFMFGDPKNINNK